jgi:hypothetical protein
MCPLMMIESRDLIVTVIIPFHLRTTYQEFRLLEVIQFESRLRSFQKHWDLFLQCVRAHPLGSILLKYAWALFIDCIIPLFALTI